MKKTTLCLALVGLLALGGQAAAVICTIDAVPASTLLLPYFEVDLNNPQGLTTLFSIANASATAILTHVVIWSDLSYPVLDFDVYLTGYDVVSINLRDIIVGVGTPPVGMLPQTASAGQDPTDTISPKGPLSQDINFASCTGHLPPAPLDSSTTLYLQKALTGNAVPSIFNACGPGESSCCYAQALGDNIARGYVTVDTENACNLCEHNSGTGPCLGGGNYFGATGFITFQNVLFGDWFIVNTPGNFAQGGDLVAVESSLTDPRVNTAGNYNFYGRYVNWNGVDRREPLATDFATRFLQGGPFSAGTSLLCWRDSKTDPILTGFPCGNLPSWYPLGQEGIAVFDEQEHIQTVAGCSHSPCRQTQLTPCPAETQRVIINGASFPVPFLFGWFYLDLNFGPTVGQVPGLTDPAAMQNWVIATYTSNGHFSVGVDAFQLDSACAAVHFFPH